MKLTARHATAALPSLGQVVALSVRESPTSVRHSSTLVFLSDTLSIKEPQQEQRRVIEAVIVLSVH